MNKKFLTILSQISLSAFLLSFFLPGLTFGQGSSGVGSTIIVSRTPYLSFDSIPSSFSFGNITTSGLDQNMFNNNDGSLPAATTVLMVSDTRNSGGFLVQAEATDFTSGSDTIDASNLRIVSTTSLTPAIAGTIVDDVIYVNDYDGTPSAGATQTVTAPINAATTNFAQVATFDAVTGNSLNSPVDILSGCLTASEGRVGSMAVGIADTLSVPAYTVPGNYSATVTYTITDFTGNPGCP